MSIDPNLLQSAISKGKTQWLQQYLSDNLPSLNLPSTNYQTWFDDFIHTLESKNLTKPSQQKNYLTNVRNAIKVLDSEHPALDVIKFSRETWIEINQQNRDRIAERSTKLIDNPDGIVSKAIELIKTNNWSDIAAGLAVVTGRRCGEIIKTASFEFKSEYSVTFRGALKRRSEAVELVFEIPVLCQSDLVIKAIDCLRLQLGNEVKTLSATQINQRYEERVAKKCDRYFSDLVPKRDGKKNLYSHLFRAVYATIATYWYCPPTIPEMEFRAAIQGHYQILDEKNPKLRRSLAASRHYFDYKIADGSGNIDGRLGIKLNSSGVEVIEQFQHHGQPLSSISNPHKQKITNNLTMNANQQSNEPEPMVSLQLSLSRLETISKLLNLSQSETINALINWAEAAASLAQSFDIDNPKALIDHVKELEHPAPHETRTHSQSASISQEEHQRLLLSVSSLSSSVELLTKALVEVKSYSFEPSKRLPEATGQPEFDHLQKSDKPTTSQTNIEKSNSKQKTRRISSENRKRDTPEVMAQDINHAIDVLLEFNDVPDRPHRQKFRISILPLKNLTGRATNSISQILKERREEIEQHHQHHQISGYHNKSRRDENGNDYPPVESEPEINYHKLTEVN